MAGSHSAVSHTTCVRYACSNLGYQAGADSDDCTTAFRTAWQPILFMCFNSLLVARKMMEHDSAATRAPLDTFAQWHVLRFDTYSIALSVLSANRRVGYRKNKRPRTEYTVIPRPSHGHGFEKTRVTPSLSQGRITQWHRHGYPRRLKTNARLLPSACTCIQHLSSIPHRHVRLRRSSFVTSF